MFLCQMMDMLFGALQQQHIAEPQNHMIDFADHRRPAAPDRQDRKPVSMGEPDLPQGLADHFTGRRQGRFDHDDVLTVPGRNGVVSLLDHRQPLFLLELQHIGRVAFDEQDVAGIKLAVAAGAGDLLLAAEDRSDLEVQFLLQAALRDRFADEWQNLRESQLR